MDYALSLAFKPVTQGKMEQVPAAVQQGVGDNVLPTPTDAEPQPSPEYEQLKKASSPAHAKPVETRRASLVLQQVQQTEAELTQGLEASEKLVRELEALLSSSNKLHIMPRPSVPQVPEQTVGDDGAVLDASMLAQPKPPKDERPMRRAPSKRASMVLLGFDGPEVLSPRDSYNGGVSSGLDSPMVSRRASFDSRKLTSDGRRTSMDSMPARPQSFTNVPGSPSPRRTARRASTLANSMLQDRSAVLSSCEEDDKNSHHSLKRNVSFQSPSSSTQNSTTLPSTYNSTALPSRLSYTGHALASSSPLGSAISEPEHEEKPGVPVCFASNASSGKRLMPSKTFNNGSRLQSCEGRTAGHIGSAVSSNGGLHATHGATATPAMLDGGQRHVDRAMSFTHRNGSCPGRRSLEYRSSLEMRYSQDAKSHVDESSVGCDVQSNAVPTSPSAVPASRNNAGNVSWDEGQTEVCTDQVLLPPASVRARNQCTVNSTQVTAASAPPLAANPAGGPTKAPTAVHSNEDASADTAVRTPRKTSIVERLKRVMTGSKAEAVHCSHGQPMLPRGSFEAPNNIRSGALSTLDS